MKSVKVFYVRRSKETINYENQIKRLKEKWGNLQVFEEEISGAKERVVLHTLLDTLPKKSTIYVAHVDRLSRAGILDFLLIVEKARSRDIAVISLHDGETDLVDQDPLLLAMKAYVAQQERAAISRRIRDAVAVSRKKHGGLWGGQIAKANGKSGWGTKTRDPIFVEALPYLKGMRESGFTFAKIAQLATAKYGKKFTAGHICRMVRE